MISSLSPRRPTASWKVLFVVCLLLASIFPIQIVPSAERNRPGANGHLSGKQGQVLWIDVPISQPKAKVSGLFLKRKIPFFPHGDTRFAGIVGIDMEDPPGMQELSITVSSDSGSDHLSYTVQIIKEDYSVQHLTLPKNTVDLDAKTLQRVQKEKKELAEAFHHIGTRPLWDGPFLEPVNGKVTGVFGSRRVINGQTRKPHSGEDIAAPKGTPVQAINKGIVVKTVDHFFSGKGVVLDHGVGLFSMYFHLSEVDVTSGQTIQKGEALGKVGATGRATGPHLHWGIHLNGSRINPYALTALPIAN
ncbi:M23 family metallopeptidase [Candidatus Nitrospira allomarina]|jgi:peptidase M23-like protein|uniref:M23 family metallopeptidase n=1 Tax=Candidatus Nitrospira allomarina TaxID=3020900 RepID=A0AA96GG90_9BACT|nr:M23 family metallopeptidase [Candidatus Nitrospira allomarina]WNM58323.1 M23 family metallopeptidase [Candidatus Nitrospira allomarina]